MWMCIWHEHRPLRFKFVAFDISLIITCVLRNYQTSAFLIEIVTNENNTTTEQQLFFVSNVFSNWKDFLFEDDQDAVN